MYPYHCRAPRRQDACMLWQTLNTRRALRPTLHPDWGRAHPAHMQKHSGRSQHTLKRCMICSKWACSSFSSSGPFASSHQASALTWGCLGHLSQLPPAFWVSWSQAIHFLAPSQLSHAPHPPPPFRPGRTSGTMSWQARARTQTRGSDSGSPDVLQGFWE